MRQPPELEPKAILVADMVGYSRRLATHPIDTHVAFKEHLDEIFTPTVHEHGGHVVKTTGDGILAILADPGEAERCACRIQLQIEHRYGLQPAQVSISYRLAVHYGLVTIEPHDIFGLDVNVTIHMQQLAPAGGVCVSGALLARLPEQSRQRYRFLGQRYLKNVPSPIAVYAHDVTSSPATPSAPERLASPRRFLSPPPRLGLVKFRAFAEHASQSALAGMADDCLAHGLSRFADVLAIAPIGAEITQIESETLKFRELLSRELACDYLLHGSCMIGAKTLTLTAQLESLARRELLWAGRFRLDLEEQIDLIDDMIIAEIIAPTVLHIGKAEAESGRAGLRSEDDSLFRKAKALMERRTRSSIEEARRLLSGITQRHGEVGDVYIALARAEHSYGLLLADESFADSLERAWQYAKKAIEVDTLNPHAHGELALQEMFLKRQGDADEIYRHALRLNPYDPMLRADWADCLVNLGQPGEAASILEGILSGWPRDRAWVEWGLCDAYWALDRPDRVVSLLDRHPDQPHVHRNLAASYAKLGKMTEAKRHAEMVRGHQPGFSAKAWRRVMPNTNRDQSDEFVDFLERAGL